MTLLDRDGVAIHYEIHHRGGDGIPLLLSHGYGASAAMWRPNLDELSRRRPVITWDIRGHGRSASPRDPACYTQSASVADMAAILDACGVGAAAVGGLSLGGFLSLAFHLAHPERVAALLLFDTGPGYRDDAGRERWNRWAIARAEAFERDGLSELGDSAEVRGGRHDPQGLALAARGILVQQTAEVIESLATVQVPVLVVVGAEDRPFLKAADYMAQHIRGATKAVIEAAGHASNIDQPAAFDAVVLRFLDGVDSDTGAAAEL